LPATPEGDVAPLPAPVLPGTQRVLSIFSRDGNPLQIDTLPTTKEGLSTTVVKGGVNLITTDAVRGTIDISADNIVIWRGPPPKGMNSGTISPRGEVLQDVKQPLEVYLEGNVIFRQDERKVAGNGDQKTYRAKRAYYDYRSDRMVALDAELDV